MPPASLGRTDRPRGRGSGLPRTFWYVNFRELRQGEVRWVPGPMGENFSGSCTVTHIPHLQTSTIGIICSCLQPVLQLEGCILAIRACFEKCSFDKEGHIDG